MQRTGSPSGVSKSQPFDEVASLEFYASEERELEAARDVVPSMAQVLDSITAKLG